MGLAHQLLFIHLGLYLRHTESSCQNLRAVLPADGLGRRLRAIHLGLYLRQVESPCQTLLALLATDGLGHRLLLLQLGQTRPASLVHVFLENMRKYKSI